MKLLETYVEISVKANQLEMGLKNARKAARDNVRGINKEFSLLDFKNPLRQLGLFQKAILGIGVGYGLKNLATGFLKTASELQNLRIGLDTITKGKGEEWFNKINEWAIRMPIATKAAIQSFTQLSAMGLQPTIDQMQILLDTTNALGGNEEVMAGIGLAIGQIYTKGKLESQEVRQLAERGIPAYEILSQKLGITATEMQRVGHATVTSKQALDALFAGMAERFGGMSKKIMGHWYGLIEQLKGYWTEFQREVMNSGVMQYLESELGKIVKRIDAMFASGEFQAKAKQFAETINNILGKIKNLGEFAFKYRNVIEIILPAAALMITVNIIAKLTANMLLLYDVLFKLGTLESVKTLFAIIGGGTAALGLVITALGAGVAYSAYQNIKSPSNYGAGAAPFAAGGGYQYNPKPGMPSNYSTAFGAGFVNRALGNNNLNLTEIISQTKTANNEITALTDEQTKALYDIQKDYQDAKIALIQNSFEKERAELEQWYTEQKKMLKDANATSEAYSILDKTKGLKLTGINTSEAISKQDNAQKATLAAIEERKKALIDANNEQIQRAKDEANKVVNLQQYIKEQTIRNTTEGYEQERQLAQAQYEWDYQQAIQQYGAKSKVLKDMAEAHRLDMVAIEKAKIKQMDAEILSFANQWANTLSNAVTQSGNAFNNIAKAFKNMVTQMAVEAAFTGVLNLLLGGSGGFAAGFLSVLPKFADGGNISANKPSIVGERGAELFVPSTSGKIIPTDVLSKMASGKSESYVDNSTTVFQFTSAETSEMKGMSDRQLAERIDTLIRQKQIKNLKKAIA